MKMKINDVLECINKALEKERERRSIITKGHFIAITEIKKALGPYKKYHISIIYVNMEEGENTEFVSKYYTHKVLKGSEDEIQKIVECNILTEFFSKIINSWDDIVRGKYGDKR